MGYCKVISIKTNLTLVEKNSSSVCWLIHAKWHIIISEASQLPKGDRIMQVIIGENIKRLRITNGLTQEKLADILGVSPQAISRWEKSTTYPDINMLPSIANYFNVSVDELLGMDEIRNEEQICQIHTKVHEAIEKGLVDVAITELRNALKLYPNDYGFMCELALALTIYQDYDVSSDNLQEAIDLSERILDKCVNDKIRSTTKANLCFLYLKAEKGEAAIQLGKTLPHVWESREVLVPQLTDTIVDRNRLMEGIRTTINVIYSKVIEFDDSDREETIKMLVLGPREFEDVDYKEKIKVISEFLYQIS